MEQAIKEYNYKRDHYRFISIDEYLICEYGATH